MSAARTWPLRWAWARWVLCGVNASITAVLSLGVVLVSVMFFPGGDIRLTDVLWSLLAALVPVLFGVLTFEQVQRRGRVMQSAIAIAALLMALMNQSIALATYGAVALIIVWLLGDFPGPLKPRPPLPTRTPQELARRLWAHGASSEQIRAELTARQLPAAEVERLLYELISTGDERRQMPPGG